MSLPHDEHKWVGDTGSVGLREFCLRCLRWRDDVERTRAPCRWIAHTPREDELSDRED